MMTRCITCNAPIEQGDYILIGVEQGSWESRYAHRGSCASEARLRFAPPEPKTRRRRSRPVATEPVIEELTFEEPDPIPSDSLPWFGAERRR